MTNEQEPGAKPSRPPGMEPEERDDSAVLEGAGDFTSGEGLVAFAGMVVLAVWVIFSILATEYFVSFVGVLLAVAAVLAPRLDRATVERVHPLPVIMKTVGYGLAILGVIVLVEDIRLGFLDEVLTVVGGLIYYAAAVMAFIGARQIEI